MNANSSQNLPSDRSFGLLISAVLFGLSIFAFIKSWSLSILIFLMLLSVPFGVVAIISPVKLRFANRIWFRFGYALGSIVSPLMLGLIYFGLITPVALISRFFGRDELSLKLRPGKSYWICCNSCRLDLESFKQQF